MAVTAQHTCADPGGCPHGSSRSGLLGGRRVPTWLMALAPIALVALAVSWAPSDSDSSSLCPFRRCTGGYCAGCGMTRGVLAAARGDVVGSFAQHPAAPFLVAEALLLWGATMATRLRLAAIDVSAIVTKRFLLVHLVVLLAVWIAQLALGTIPRPTEFALR